MDNRNTYQPNPYINQNGYYPSYYPAAAAPTIRPEVPAYMMQQVAAPAVLKGRPVASFEEARASQIDLDGSTTFFPDLGNKKIYTKRINVDGTACLQVYSLDSAPTEIPQSEYATKNEVNELKATIGELLNQLKASSTQNQTQPKINL
jgi:hypothetical protein